LPDSALVLISLITTLYAEKSGAPVAAVICGIVAVLLALPISIRIATDVVIRARRQ
jgi:hypothetical protein